MPDAMGTGKPFVWRKIPLVACNQPSDRAPSEGIEWRSQHKLRKMDDDGGQAAVCCNVMQDYVTSRYAPQSKLGW
jgi:hypothetical protein